MKIKLSAHGAYHHQYHVVWIPKYRKKVLKGELKQYLEKGLFDIETFHPDIEIETLSIQVDHIHLVIVVPPKYAVSDIVRKIKANTSRENSHAFSLDQEGVLAERILVRRFFLFHGWGQRRRHQKVCGVSGASRPRQSTTRFRVLVPKCHGRKPVGIYLRRQVFCRRG